MQRRKRSYGLRNSGTLSVVSLLMGRLTFEQPTVQVVLDCATQYRSQRIYDIEPLENEGIHFFD